MSEQLVPMLQRLTDKVANMRPVPPCDNLFDYSWGKVDKLILKTMKAMQEKGVKRPLHPLSETLLEMSLKDVAENYPKVSQALQTVTYRAMDTRLLVDEFSRMRQVAVAIRDISKGRKGVKEPPPDFPPESPAMVPPCFVGRDVYNDGASWVVETFAEELRARGILPQKKQERE